MKARRPDWIYDGSQIPDPFGYGERAVDFIKRLKHPKSQAKDQAFELPYFWERIVRRVYGDCRDDGKRKISTVFCLLPRGARKTTMGAALSLLHTFGWERQPLGQVIAAAYSKKQSEKAYKELSSIISVTPWLEQVAKDTESLLKVEHPKSGCTFEAISSDGSAHLGGTPNFALMDEIILWNTKKHITLWDAIDTGLLKTSNSLQFMITQAGAGQENLAYKELEKARKVASGKVIDEGYLPIIYEADPKCDWKDEKIWHFVNPGLGEGFPDLDGMRRKAKKGEYSPEDRESFKQFNLNIWREYSHAPFIEMAIYDKGNKSVDLEALRGEPCWIGVDLSSTTDLTAVVAAWRDGEGYQVHPWFFCPADNLEDRERRDQVPYVQWAKDGLIEPTPGNVIDYKYVEDRIRRLCDEYNVKEIAFDPHMAQQIMNNLSEDGLPALEMSQKWNVIGPAVREVERALLSGRLIHGGHPILKWHFSNVAVVRDSADNKVFHKGKSRDRIDGAQACAMAIARAANGDDTRSWWDTDQAEGADLVSL